MNKKVYRGRLGAAVLCLVLLGGAAGCAPQPEPAKETSTAKAELKLETEKSVYPYLVFQNVGQGDAEDVRVFEAKGGQELTALGVSEHEKLIPAQKPLTLAPGTGVHYQLLSRDLREYTVKWTEEGQAHQMQMTLKEPGHIETH
ncbi:hypothetical protein EV586_11217 [Tumebacillus sp. BK434]|uniref:hypothetical protein n=1 Tax=Tumebacillus sp. BK434 TaxID=2512169 RepID=UPI001042A4A1|nr:hypothetical protein [Tumebacillus sp. BK434]TCP52257.1 hypothetical protein EV586_11217 [Tumebacillus sp. BK434]